MCARARARAYLRARSASLCVCTCVGVCMHDRNRHSHPPSCMDGNTVAASAARLRFMALYMLFRQFSLFLSFSPFLSLSLPFSLYLPASPPSHSDIIPTDSLSLSIRACCHHYHHHHHQSHVILFRLSLPSLPVASSPTIYYLFLLSCA